MRTRLRGPVGRVAAVGGIAAISVLATGCGAALDGTLEPDAVATADLDGASQRAEPEGERPADLAGLQDTLDAAAVAFRAGDPDALRPLLLDPTDAFGRRWLARAEAMAALPLAHYELRVDPTIDDLTTTRVRVRYDDPAVVVDVVEELAFEGYDDPAMPAREDLFLTAVATPDGWRIAGDTDAEPLGLVSVDHLWDHGPVTVTRRGPILAISHPEMTGIEAVIDEAVAAVAAANERWPLAWPGRVPLLIPRDEEELAELLHVTFDLSNFVAFATVTVSGELGDHELTGPRIMVNPERFLQRDSATRSSILVHELVHVATQSASGPFVPSWLDEGVAQALGERRSTTGTRLLDALVSDDVGLPLNGQFTTGGRDRIFLSYQLAWSFVDHLRDTYGAEAVARFYAAAGRDAIGRPGTEAWHLDRAAREVFDASLGELESAWRAAASGG